MARILVTGTLAIDYIATYPGVFAGLPQHPGINLSIHLGKIDRRFGGCAMNIVYSLKLLGHEPIPFVFVGDDFDGDYQRHLERLGIERDGIIAVSGAAYSSHAFIFTDRDNNQFTGFYPGPARVEDFAERLTAFIDANDFSYAVVAPDVPGNMITAAAILNDKGVPFLSDPGQGLTDFTPDDIRAFLALSRELIVNEFEHQTMLERAGAEALDHLTCLVVTLGADGARSGATRVAAAPAGETKDPTGCGDAFRAGYVDARLRGAGTRDALRAGAVVATVNLEVEGSQLHSLDTYYERYTSTWNDRPGWLSSTA